MELSPTVFLSNKLNTMKLTNGMACRPRNPTTKHRKRQRSTSTSPPNTPGFKRRGYKNVLICGIQKSFHTSNEVRSVNAYKKERMLGQGTYGTVFVGVSKQSKEKFALKRTRMDYENGVSYCTIREIKILKSLKHKNIIEMKEVVTSKDYVFLVLELMDHDLLGVLNHLEIHVTQHHIKSWTRQLLDGIDYMHSNDVMHRDLKPSNLLINANGQLKIADWGLARSWKNGMKLLTNNVISLWYRPPELLMGCTEYSSKVDMWSAGCVIVEMFRRRGLWNGDDEAEQLGLIFRTCGHPTEEDWPDIESICSLWKKIQPRMCSTPGFPNRLETTLKLPNKQPNSHPIPQNAIQLISKLLSLNPDTRYSAKKALLTDYCFHDSPYTRQQKTNQQPLMKIGV